MPTGEEPGCSKAAPPPICGAGGALGSTLKEKAGDGDGGAM